MGSDGSETAPAAIRLKRAYEAPEARDGVRVLVDRLWPRGISKGAAGLDAWMKELGPTAELRTWFGHRPDRWAGFVERYRQELTTPPRQLLLAELAGIAGGTPLTLVYAARDTEENEAVVLRHYLLHEPARPVGGWDASAKLLLTVAAVAAAHRDAIATAAGLRLFAAPILTEREIDEARADLLTRGQLREAAGGWRVAPGASRRLRQLSGAEPATESSS